MEAFRDQRRVSMYAKLLADIQACISPLLTTKDNSSTPQKTAILSPQPIRVISLLHPLQELLILLTITGLDRLVQKRIIHVPWISPVELCLLGCYSALDCVCAGYAGRKGRGQLIPGLAYAQ
ncbi:Chitinase 1 [Fusarium oxysporum f. sp. albedinis]|nr:Chitinase 1 [Fusarium oxysporum f. sp. albedinis]